MNLAADIIVVPLFLLRCSLRINRLPSKRLTVIISFFSGARVGAEKCFDLNKRGEEGANCGRDKFGYISCAPL